MRKLKKRRLLSIMLTLSLCIGVLFATTTLAMAEEKQPYDITINYVDASTNGLIYSEDVTVAVDGFVNYRLPSSFVAEDGSSYELADERSNVLHAYGDSDTVYSVQYQLVEQDEPYEVSINCVNLSTEEVIQAMQMTVNPGEELVYHLSDNETLTIDGVKYELADDRQSISHFYGNDQRSYSVYYAEAAKDTESITVRYIDQETNEVLQSFGQDVLPGSYAQIQIQKSLTIADQKYDFSAAQGSDINYYEGTDGNTYFVYDYGTEKKIYDVYFVKEVKETEKETVPETTEETAETKTETTAADNNTGSQTVNNTYNYVTYTTPSTTTVSVPASTTGSSSTSNTAETKAAETKATETKATETKAAETAAPSVVKETAAETKTLETNKVETGNTVIEDESAPLANQQLQDTNHVNTRTIAIAVLIVAAIAGGTFAARKKGLF